MNNPSATALLVGACALLSFLCSGMEAGVFSLSPMRIRQQVRQGRRRARLLQGYLEHPERLLWTIMVGNVLTSFVVVSLIVATLYRWSTGHWGWFLAGFVPLMFVFYSFCDLLPKMLFSLFPNRLCLGAVVPFKFLHVALSPLVALMAWSSRFLARWTGSKAFTGNLFGSREELRSLMQESAAALTSEERAMINRVLDLQQITVGQVARPMSKVLTAETRTPVGQLLDRLRQEPHSEVPVWEENAGSRRITGTVSLRTLLYTREGLSAKCVQDCLRPALFMPTDLRLDFALRRMQRSGRRLAIVLGPNRRELGIVTLQDVLGAVFGDVEV